MLWVPLLVVRAREHTISPVPASMMTMIFHPRSSSVSLQRKKEVSASITSQRRLAALQTFRRIRHPSTTALALYLRITTSHKT